MFSARNIWKHYEARPIVNGISFDVLPGSITGIVGPNGAGKSTLLRCLTMLDLPDRGQITVDGTEYSFPAISREPRLKPWPSISAVLQDVYLWPHLTVRKNLSLSLRDLDATQRELSVSSVIDSLGLGPIQSQTAGRISGGERQRVAIGRALLLRTRYLFLDEPTSSLDVRSISKLSTSIRELARRGVGVTIVSHLFGFLRDTVQRIVYIEDGQIVESGGIHLLESPDTAQMKEFIACI